MAAYLLVAAAALACGSPGSSFAAAVALEGPVDYKAQAAMVKELMEAGRRHPKTETEVPAPKMKAHSEGEDQSDIDMALMSTANRIAEDMEERQQAKKTNSKVKSLLSSKAKVTQGSAARFFAKHGMDKVAHLLGHEVSKQESHSSAATSVNAARGKAAAVRHVVHSSPMSHMDELMAEDEAGMGSDSRWRAVDALERHKPHFE